MSDSPLTFDLAAELNELLARLQAVEQAGEIELHEVVRYVGLLTVGVHALLDALGWSTVRVVWRNVESGEVTIHVLGPSGQELRARRVGGSGPRLVVP